MNRIEFAPTRHYMTHQRVTPKTPRFTPDSFNERDSLLHQEPRWLNVFIWSLVFAIMGISACIGWTVGGWLLGVVS